MNIKQAVTIQRVLSVVLFIIFSPIGVMCIGFVFICKMLKSLLDIPEYIESIVGHHIMIRSDEYKNGHIQLNPDEYGTALGLYEYLKNINNE